MHRYGTSSGATKYIIPKTLMKALTLHQPWASLIADGRKAIETRSWPPPRTLIGKRIAIHAGKEIDRPLFDRWLAGQSVPLGAILCTARIAELARVAHSDESGH